MPEPKDKGADEERTVERERKPPKPPGFRQLEKLLRQAVNAPPLRKNPDAPDTACLGDS